MSAIVGPRQPPDRRDWFDHLEAFTRAVNRLFAAAACVLVLVIMTTIMIQIVYRFLLDDPIAWVLDITIFLLVFVFFLAVAPALQSSSHIEVDMFDSLIPKRHHKAVRLIGKLLTYWALKTVLSTTYECALMGANPQQARAATTDSPTPSLAIH